VEDAEELAEAQSHTQAVRDKLNKEVQYSRAQLCIPIYCESILICGAFNYVEFVGKTIHKFKYQQYKIPSVRLSNARFTC